jgi:hypothetical protein
MFTSGAKYPGAVVGSGPGTDFVDHAYVKSGTDALAAAVVNVSSGSVLTKWLKCTAFGFTIPTGATIVGIKATVRHCGVEMV